MDLNKFKIITGNTVTYDKYVESFFLAKIIKENSIQCAVVISESGISNCNFFIKSAKIFQEENLQHEMIFISSEDDIAKINMALTAIENNEKVVIFDAGALKRCKKSPNIDCVMIRGSRNLYQDYIVNISYCLEYLKEKESKVLVPLFTKRDFQNFKSIINTIKCVKKFSRKLEMIETYSL